MTSAGFIAVGVGAALGAWARWALAVLLNASFPMLPLGTLAANLIGGFGIGIAVEVFARHVGLSEEMRLFVHDLQTIRRALEQPATKSTR